MLKFHSSSGAAATLTGQGGPGKPCYSPIITFDNILIRTVATGTKYNKSAEKLPIQIPDQLVHFTD